MNQEAGSPICKKETDSQTLQINLVTKGGRLGVGMGDGLGVWNWHMYPEVHGMFDQWGSAL